MERSSSWAADAGDDAARVRAERGNLRDDYIIALSRLRCFISPGDRRASSAVVTQKTKVTAASTARRKGLLVSEILPLRSKQRIISENYFWHRAVFRFPIILVGLDPMKCFFEKKFVPIQSTSNPSMKVYILRKTIHTWIGRPRKLLGAANMCESFSIKNSLDLNDAVSQWLCGKPEISRLCRVQNNWN